MQVHMAGHPNVNLVSWVSRTGETNLESGDRWRCFSFVVFLMSDMVTSQCVWHTLYWGGPFLVPGEVIPSSTTDTFRCQAR